MLQSLAEMPDDEVLPSLALYELLCAEFSPAKKDLEGLFTGAAMNLGSSGMSVRQSYTDASCCVITS